MSISRVLGAVLIVLGSLSALGFVQWVLLCELGSTYPFGSALRALYPPSWTSGLPITQYNSLSFCFVFVGHFLYAYGPKRTALFMALSFAFLLAVEWVGTACPFDICPFGRYEWLAPIKSGYPFDNIRVFGDVAAASVVNTAAVYFGYAFLLGQYIFTRRFDISTRAIVGPALVGGFSVMCLSFMVEQSGYGPYDTTCFARVGAFDPAANPDTLLLNHVPLRNHLLWAPIGFAFSIAFNVLSTALFGETQVTGGNLLLTTPWLLTTTPFFYAMLFSRPILVRQVAFSFGMAPPMLFWARYAMSSDSVPARAASKTSAGKRKGE